MNCLRYQMLFTLLWWLFALILRGHAETFPNKPIKVVVYMKPGGLVDRTARQFTDIAKKYTDATFVIENRPGSGGIIAIRDVLSRPADGYTLCAVTKSNIASIVSSGKLEYLDSLDWVALLMHDPECILTLKDADISSWTDVLADAKRQKGQQTWVGPSKGGLDHIVAIKVWERFGMQAKWIPFESGGEAKVALLGQQGVAYVGNPDDAAGNDAFRIAAISHPNRLAQFPDVPTFGELGVPALDNETMWRGFALRKDCPSEARAWFDSLFQKVTNDPAWRSAWEPSGIEVVYQSEAEFESLVESDRIEFVRYLSRLGIIQQNSESSPTGGLGASATLLIGSLIFSVVGGVALGLKRSIDANYLDSIGRLLIPVGLLSVCATFWLRTTRFAGNEQAGPEMVPRVWMVCLIPISVYLLIKAIRSQPTSLTSDDVKAVSTSADANRTEKRPVWIICVSLAVYLLLIPYAGYFVATGIGLPAFMGYLGYRKIPTILLGTIGWLLISYFLFERLLYVPLPNGMWFASLGLG